MQARYGKRPMIMSIGIFCYIFLGDAVLGKNGVLGLVFVSPRLLSLS
jgi:hypothetical protein